MSLGLDIRGPKPSRQRPKWVQVTSGQKKVHRETGMIWNEHQTSTLNLYLKREVMGSGDTRADSCISCSVGRRHRRLWQLHGPSSKRGNTHGKKSASEDLGGSTKIHKGPADIRKNERNRRDNMRQHVTTSS